MKRTDIITRVGREYLTSNVENDEFSYQKALKEIGKSIRDYVGMKEKVHTTVDIRFVKQNMTVLVETKKNFNKSGLEDAQKQLQDYVTYETELTGNKIIAILSNTDNDEVRVWQDGSNIIDSAHQDNTERVIRPLKEYEEIHFGTKNDKLTLVQSTYALNELLHKYSINEKIRSQFVGTCLLALKNKLYYENVSTKQIISGIEEILTDLLEKDLNKATKLAVLKNKVLDSQDVRDLKAKEFQEILRKIEKDILPYINDKNTAGQDLLNLFFTTFNKYVGKADKNQAFTPDHIVHFICRVVGINRHSVVLDPCCGSGAFLVRALTDALDDCDTYEEREHVKQKQIYGIEYEETAFGLSTTNMLIHGDGNSNIVQGSCFVEENYIGKGVNVVLMNPPYNAQRKHCHPDYVKTWKENVNVDPSKGLHFVYEIAKKVKTGKLAVLLPMQCAIGANADLKYFKKKLLEEHTLDAVFSLPKDMFHPGSAAIACCMVFNLGVRHENAPVKETFFGYYKEDGFVKKKNLGRIELSDESGIGLWKDIEKEWLYLYHKRITKEGLSIVKKVSAADEWLAEAYMETDYSKLNETDFQKVLNEYLGYLMSNGRLS